MKNVTNFYRVIKSIQGIIILILGILFAIFFQNTTMYSALNYSLASVVMIYGILSILFSYLFQRGIASTDTLSGIILISVSFFIFFNPESVTNYLPMIFGTILITYSIVLFIEVAINSFNLIKLNKIPSSSTKIKQVNIKNIIIFSLVGAIFLSLGIIIIIFGSVNSGESEQSQKIIVLIIGIILILIGLFLAIYPLISPKKDVIISDSKLIKDVSSESTQLQKSPSNSKKPRKTQTKNKNSETVKELPNYEIDKKEN